MKKYGVRYHQRVKDDIKKIDTSERKRIRTAIEDKLQVAPEMFGEKLKGTHEISGS